MRLPFKSFIRTLIRFAKRPHARRVSRTSLRWRIRVTARLTLFGLLWTIVILVIRGLLDLTTVSPSGEMPDREWDSFAAILGMVLLVPLIEEGVFRLPLRLTPSAIGVAAGLICIWAGRGVLMLIFPDAAKAEYNMVRTDAVITGIIVALLLRTETGLRALRKCRKLGFKPLVWISSILFGWVHVTNYVPGTYGIISALLVTMAHGGTGFIKAWLMLRFGFFWAFLSHALHNLIVVAFVVL